MRKIEREMLQAIRERRNWQSGNTQVAIVLDESTELPIYADVRLHGNDIATADLTADDAVIPNLDTFRCWPTRTAVSRLRALGVDASIKNSAPCIDGQQV